MITEFSQKLACGSPGQNMATKWLIGRGWDVTDVSGDAEYQKRGIDIVASKGGDVWDIEVKTDSRIAETGNIVYELLSCAERATQGWAYYIGATHLFYIDDAAKRLHVIKVNMLRELVRRGGAQRRVGTAQTKVWQGVYTTVFLLLTVNEIRSLAPHGGYKEFDLSEAIQP